jgi:CNT family concentrative nucleoside transporter
MIGIPLQDCSTAGTLLGQKLVINELVAYSNMVKETLSSRSVAILTYAIAGFANFSCIGIQIGGIGALCPAKREMLTKLGLRALLGGTLTNLLNAAIASLLI